MFLVYVFFSLGVGLHIGGNVTSIATKEQHDSLKRFEPCSDKRVESLAPLSPTPCSLPSCRQMYMEIAHDCGTSWRKYGRCAPFHRQHFEHVAPRSNGSDESKVPLLMIMKNDVKTYWRRDTAPERCVANCRHPDNQHERLCDPTLCWWNEEKELCDFLPTTSAAAVRLTICNQNVQSCSFDGRLSRDGIYNIWTARSRPYRRRILRFKGLLESARRGHKNASDFSFSLRPHQVK